MLFKKITLVFKISTKQGIISCVLKLKIWFLNWMKSHGRETNSKFLETDTHKKVKKPKGILCPIYNNNLMPTIFT